MMTLSTMWSVVRLKRSEGGNPLVDVLLDRWRHDPHSVHHYRSSANLLFVFRAAGKLDFDDCHVAPPEVDAAYARSNLFPLSFDASVREFQAFVRCDRTCWPLDDPQIDTIQLFLRLAKVVAYGCVTRDVDLPEGDKFPEWLTRLQRKLRSHVQTREPSLDGGTQ